jgi:hypothetical protein
MLVKTLIEVLFLWLPLATSTMYSMCINGCNPYANWYGVYLIATFYAILYENNTIDRHSSQFVLLSLTNLVERVPSTLLIDSTCPFPCG